MLEAARGSSAVGGVRAPPTRLAEGTAQVLEAAFRVLELDPANAQAGYNMEYSCATGRWVRGHRTACPAVSALRGRRGPRQVGLPPVLLARGTFDLRFLREPDRSRRGTG